MASAATRAVQARSARQRLSSGSGGPTVVENALVSLQALIPLLTSATTRVGLSLICVPQVVDQR